MFYVISHKNRKSAHEKSDTTVFEGSGLTAVFLREIDKLSEEEISVKTIHYFFVNWD